MFQADETKFRDFEENPIVRAYSAAQSEFSSAARLSGHAFFYARRFHLSCKSRRYAANGVRLPKGAAFGRAKIVCKRKKGKSVVFPFLSICFKASAILHSTFYIYNGDPSVRAGKPALTQDDRGDSACSPTLAFPLGGRCHSERMTDEGRRYIRVRAAKGRARFLKNFIKLCAVRLTGRRVFCIMDV